MSTKSRGFGFPQAIALLLVIAALAAFEPALKMLLFPESHQLVCQPMGVERLFGASLLANVILAFALYARAMRA